MKFIQKHIIEHPNLYKRKALEDAAREAAQEIERLKQAISDIRRKNAEAGPENLEALRVDIYSIAKEALEDEGTK